MSSLCGTFVTSAAVVLVMNGVGIADTITLSPTADARINKGSPTTNYGGDTILTARASADANTYKSYLKFSFADVPASAQITTVTLNLTAVNSTGVSVVAWWNQSVAVFGLEDATWSEDTINWDNATSNNTSNNGNPSTSSFLSPTQSLGSFNAIGTTGAYGYAFDLNNAAVSAWFEDVADGGTITLMLSTAGSSNQLIGSKEGAFDPSLTVNYVIPEPGAMALMTLGSLLVLGGRRRA